MGKKEYKKLWYLRFRGDKKKRGFLSLQRDESMTNYSPFIQLFARGKQKLSFLFGHLRSKNMLAYEWACKNGCQLPHISHRVSEFIHFLFHNLIPYSSTSLRRNAKSGQSRKGYGFLQGLLFLGRACTWGRFSVVMQARACSNNCHGERGFCCPYCKIEHVLSISRKRRIRF